MDENKKYIVDFFKLLTGFASGSFLLVINFISSKNDAMNILKADCFVKILIILSLFFFTASIVVGIRAIQKAINTINEEFVEKVNFRKCRKWFFNTFIYGYFFLLFGIIFLLFDVKFCDIWNCLFNR